jgi:hypothetical protein
LKFAGGTPATSTLLPSLFGGGLPKKPESAPPPATSSGLSSLSILGAAKETAKDVTKEDKTSMLVVLSSLIGAEKTNKLPAPRLRMQHQEVLHFLLS